MLDRLEELEAKVQHLMSLPSVVKDLADERKAILEAKEKADKEAKEKEEARKKAEIEANQKAAAAAAEKESRPVPEFSKAEPEKSEGRISL